MSWNFALDFYEELCTNWTNGGNFKAVHIKAVAWVLPETFYQIDGDTKNKKKS